MKKMIQMTPVFVISCTEW